MKNFLYYYGQTFKNVVKNQSILVTMVLSVFFYSFFYPTAYKAEHAEHLPIVIVDEEQSLLTQKIINEVSKQPDVTIQTVTSDFLYAKSLVEQQKADGILLLPNRLSESLRHGETGGIGIYLSLAYFLKTKQVGLGVASSIEQILMEHFAKFGQVSHFNLESSIHKIPLFNPLSGYGSYIFPAVAPLIIHQTIFLGLCMLIAQYREKKWHTSLAEFWAIYAVALTIGCLSSFYLFGFSFWFFDFPRGGNFWAMMLAVPIFVSCVIAMGMLFASFLDMSERAGHVVVFTSIPLFLLTGTAWPHQAMPEWMQQLAWILPSTHGVQMFVQLNQMGVSIIDVVPKLIYLSCVAMIGLAFAYVRLKKC